MQNREYQKQAQLKSEPTPEEWEVSREYMAQYIADVYRMPFPTPEEEALAEKYLKELNNDLKVRGIR